MPNNSPAFLTNFGQILQKRQRGKSSIFIQFGPNFAKMATGKSSILSNFCQILQKRQGVSPVFLSNFGPNVATHTFSQGFSSKIWKVHKAIYSLLHFSSKIVHFQQDLIRSQAYSLVHFRQNLISSQGYI